MIACMLVSGKVCIRRVSGVRRSVVLALVVIKDISTINLLHKLFFKFEFQYYLQRQSYDKLYYCST